MKLGATVLNFPALGEVLVVKGEHPNGVSAKEFRRLGGALPQSHLPKNYEKSESFSSASFRLNSEKPLAEDLLRRNYETAEKAKVWLLHHSRALPSETTGRMMIKTFGFRVLNLGEGLLPGGVWVEGIFDELKTGETPLHISFLRRIPV